MREYSAEEKCLIWLQSAKSLTWRGREALLMHYGSAQAVFAQLDAAVRTAIGDKPYRELATMKAQGETALLRRMEKNGVQAVFRGEAGFPPLLAEIADPPQTLFVRGSVQEDVRSVAIVGSRRETRYGRTQAFAIARDLAMAGVTVVSGLARGIDTAAHEGALAGGGRTVAVLGSGLERIYPEENKALAERIIAGGGAIITEFALEAEPLSYHFPIRNRIVSGMSAAVLLVEGHVKSGALITAGYAAEQGREVFALPGMVDAPGSAAPLKLLREGASICTGAQDILDDMGWRKMTEAAPCAPEPEEILKGLSDMQRRIARLMLDEPHSFEELAAETQIAPDQLMGELTLMEMDGIIEPRAGRIYAIKSN